MHHTEQWIWLPKNKYPNNQKTIFNGFNYDVDNSYTVAEFDKKYSFSQKIISAALRFSGDTAFQLYCNQDIIATGPPCVGGDFIGNETARDNFYAFETVIEPSCTELHFFARVRMSPVQICEYSKGHGGFMLSAILTFEDGTEKCVFTDESWSVRKNGSYCGTKNYNGRIKPDAFMPAECIENIWQTQTAPIPIREEHEIFSDNSCVSLDSKESKKLVLNFDKIYSGFVHIKIKAKGEVYVSLFCRETEEALQNEERLVAISDSDYRGFFLHSAGKIEAEIQNSSAFSAEITISFIETHYPIYEQANTITSDSNLNLVLEVCKHTLKICRQTHHLDSPRHCEPLACTGDYYIESLMTPFSFGDMRLAEFDLIRTAVMLERENGCMFHTTYSLIWVRMLYDVYMFTGRKGLLADCKNALQLLLKRFETYIGRNSLIETPPNYMFIDWIYIDGFSMHHPPKALGQTCLNMFYFHALCYAEKIFTELRDLENAAYCHKKSRMLQKAINTILFDSEKGIYFEGLNTPTSTELIGEWMPQNAEKRYYLKHSNILAAYTGVCDDETAKEIIHCIMSEKIEGKCQPYFMHWLLEAIERVGLREEYTLKVIEQWIPYVLECPKGLTEGFVSPEQGYLFDHSHAWGGTPLYSLPKALTGFEVLSPGMRKIKFAPSLLGLTFAKIELLTPCGKVMCELEKGKPPIITAPEEIQIIQQK